MNRFEFETADERIQRVLSQSDYLASERLGLIPTGPLLDRYKPRPVSLPVMPEAWGAVQ